MSDRSSETGHSLIGLGWRTAVASRMKSSRSALARWTICSSRLMKMPSSPCREAGQTLEPRRRPRRWARRRVAGKLPVRAAQAAVARVADLAARRQRRPKEEMPP